MSRLVLGLWLVLAAPAAAQLSYCDGDRNAWSCTCDGSLKFCSNNADCLLTNMGLPPEGQPNGYYPCCRSCTKCALGTPVGMTGDACTPTDGGKDPDHECSTAGAACKPPSSVCATGTCRLNPSALVTGMGVPSNLTSSCSAGILFNTDCDGLVHRGTCIGGATTHGDPLALANARTVHTEKDLSFMTPLGPVEFSRRFDAEARTWGWGQALISKQRDGGVKWGARVEPPFGTDRTGSSLHWSHNFYAFVTVRESEWLARDEYGDLQRFLPCSNAPCFGAPLEEVADGTRLEWDGTQFRLYRRGQHTLVFAHEFNASNIATQAEFHLLSRIDDEQRPGAGEAQRTLATLTWFDTELQHVSLAGGAEWAMHYTGGKLTSIGVTPPGGVEATAVTYSYLFSWAYGTELLTSVSRARGDSEEYFYDSCSNCTPSPIFQVNVNGLQVLKHTFTVDNLASDYTFTERTSLKASSDMLSQSWNDAVAPGTGQAVANASAAELVSAPVSMAVTHRVLGVLVSSESRACRGRECTGNATRSWGWDTQNVLLPTRATNEKGYSTITSFVQGTTPPGEPVQWEATTLAEGVPLDGGAAGATTTRTFGYFGGAQKLTSESEPSVLSLGQAATTHHVFDTTTGRLKAEIRSGFTQVWNGAAWQTEARTIGTFYFTSSPCTGGAADLQGRVREVHGPCLASGPTATDCSPNQGVVPVTTYEYWPAGSGADTGFLRRMTSYPNVTSLASCGGVAVSTTYSGYDVSGHASVVEDANGVATTMVWSNGQLQSRTTDGKQEVFAYDGAVLRSIRKPEGNYEVFCHRVSSPGSGCPTTAAWSPQLQWKAKSADPDGVSWSEAVVYVHYADGRVKREEYWDGPSNTRRREVSFDHDFRGNVAYRRPGTDYRMVEKSTWDSVGDLVAIPAAHVQNGPATQVQANGTIPANNASVLLRDGLRRIGALDMPNQGATTASGDIARTCFSYDAQSNLTRMRLGCPLGAGDTCTTCTTPAVEYQHDDFGNVVSVSGPWTGVSGAPGQQRYAWDASGHETRRQTPAMVATGEAIETSWDGLGRALQARRVGPATDVLWTNTWDAVSVPAACPQPSRVVGRLAMREDTFGRTHFQYDARGLLLGEVRRRGALVDCAGAAPQDVPHTLYEYTANGGRSAVVMPYGRRVEYVFGVLGGVTTDRVSSVVVRLYDGAAWQPWTALSGVRWEPYGGLRGYQANPQAGTAFGVEWVLGGAVNDSPTGNCPMAIPTAGDASGLLRGLWVTRGAWTPGVAGTPLLQRVYTYLNRTLSRQDTCYLGGAVARSTEMFSYTAPGALKAASPLGGPLGGNAVGRSWTYDARLNRATQLLVTQPDTLTYATGVSDRLTQVQFGYGWPTQTLAYDVDGRVTSIAQPADSSGQPSWQLQLSPAAAGAANGGLESVYRGVTVNGLTWSYYYDATNRRRLKVYPTGEQDEYFHDADSSLLVDVGVDVLGGATKRPTDEYVWLDGRPVLVVRGRMTLGYVREADSQVSCGRNGEAATCGAYFLVTDNLNKPAVILDGVGKVSAFVDFSAQGEVNAVPMSQFKTASPYAANSNVAIGGALSLTGLVQPPGLQHDVRINYGMVDTEGPVGAPIDAVQVKAYTSGGVFIANMGGPVGGAHRGHVTTPWMGVLDGGVTLNLRFTSNGSNCPPTGPCSPATWPYSGVNAVNYEYRRREAGAAAFSTPLRFPGQYYDNETGLDENWNRFFDATKLRYLSPEPLLRSPGYAHQMAAAGMSVPTYSYASNNPLAFTDPTGLFSIQGGDECQQAALRAAIEALQKRAQEQKQCGAEMSSLKKNWIDDFVEGQGPTITIEPGLETPYTDWNGNIHMMADVRWLTENHVLHEFGHSSLIRGYGAWNTVWLGRRAQEALAVGAEMMCMGRSFGGTGWKRAWQLPVSP